MLALRYFSLPSRGRAGVGARRPQRLCGTGCGVSPHPNLPPKGKEQNQDRVSAAFQQPTRRPLSRTRCGSALPCSQCPSA
ncbi:hypothetical protein DBV14_07165 [Variovorax sp. KBW07]|nr:hypothetical protein DBV14_07165 [Variovorax sp. KBW07]